MRSYARQVDQALRPFLGGVDVPLILAAAEPLASVFRSVNSYPYLVATTIAGNPETTADGDLAAQARLVLDELYAGELSGLHELYELRVGQGRASSDVAEVARAATYGAVDTVLVDIDAVVAGSINEETGELRFGEPDATTYGVLDEIARRVWLSGGRVLAVRAADIPGGNQVAALLRYAPFGR
jgi:hypothetical protein